MFFCKIKNNFVFVYHNKNQYQLCKNMIFIIEATKIFILKYDIKILFLNKFLDYSKFLQILIKKKSAIECLKVIILFKNKVFG